MLGLPFYGNRPDRSRDDIVSRRQDGLSPFVTSKNRVLRHKSRSKSIAALALFVGTYKGDYVTDVNHATPTSILTSSFQTLPPIRGRKIAREMGKQEVKGQAQRGSGFNLFRSAFLNLFRVPYASLILLLPPTHLADKIAD